MLVPKHNGSRPDEAGPDTAAVHQLTGRRQFFKSLGVVGAALALSPKLALADPIAVEGEAYRNCVMGFVDVICQSNSEHARWINEIISIARVSYSPRNDNLHYTYASPHIFVDTLINREEVICRNGFMVERFPYYGVDCSCPALQDLNVPEMLQVTNDAERKRFGCVLAPKGERLPYSEESDHTDYQRTINMSYYPHNPSEWKPVYKRKMTKKDGTSFNAYGLLNKSSTPGHRIGSMVISSYDI
jgi:hypothetical protein